MPKAYGPTGWNPGVGVCLWIAEKPRGAGEGLERMLEEEKNALRGDPNREEDMAEQARRGRPQAQRLSRHGSRGALQKPLHHIVNLRVRTADCRYHRYLSSAG